jgi:PKD repeat protein
MKQFSAIVTFILLSFCTSFAVKFKEGVLYFKVKESSAIEIAPFEHSVTKEYNDAYFKNKISEYGITKIHKPFKTKANSIQHIYEIKFTKEEKIEKLIKDLQQFDFIEYAEKQQLYPLSFIPNDVHANQWYMGLIQAYAAWDISAGNNQVKVAIIDNAFHIAHSDLSGSVYINPNEIPGNLLDDDNNGFIDDVNGFDVSDQDGDPEPPHDIFWQFGLWDHGSHCAGIAAAATNNANGIASIGNGIKFIPVKTVPNGGIPLAINDGPAGIDYAITAGADVISMSWGGAVQDLTVTTFLNYASSQGIVLVAAAGNDGTQTINYPAADSNVISVAALARNDYMASFSQYGNTIDVVAPGDSIWSSVATPSLYGYQSGTSMACPMVAGLCALMLSYDTSYTPTMIESCLKAGCENIDAKNPSCLNLIGAGRVNALRSLTCMNAALGPIASYHNSIQTGVCIDSVLYFYSNSINADSLWWSFQNGSPATSTSINPVVSYSSAGSYSVQLIAKNSYGIDTVNSAVTVYNPPVASFTMSNDTVYTNNPLTLTNTSFNATNQLWVFGDGDSAITVNTSHIYTVPGTYIVTLEVWNAGCKHTVTQIVVVLLNTSINNKTNSIKLSIYPNPAKEKIIIESINGGIGNVQIFNTVGQLVNTVENKKQQQLVIDTHKYVEGIYYVKINVGEIVVNKKISIVK